jgi:hypothetical protein
VLAVELLQLAKTAPVVKSYQPAVTRLMDWFFVKVFGQGTDVVVLNPPWLRLGIIENVTYRNFSEEISRSRRRVREDFTSVRFGSEINQDLVAIDFVNHAFVAEAVMLPHVGERAQRNNLTPLLKNDKPLSYFER